MNPLEVKKAIYCPRCGKKLGNSLEGIYETTCPRCHAEVVVDRRIAPIIK